MPRFELPQHIFRVGLINKVFTLPNWIYAPFGGRFDDPDGTYRCLYCAEKRYGAFLEKLQRYRPDLATLRELEAIANAAPMEIKPVVPDKFFFENRAARAGVDIAGDLGIFDLATARGMADAHAAIEAATRRSGHVIHDYTAATLLDKNPREFTQAISRVIYEYGYAGIAYRSCYDPDAVCFALFENRYNLNTIAEADILRSDEEFLAASRVHHLEVVIKPVSAPKRHRPHRY
ncbi:MAG: RES family NAD+ phosphorylase [Vulcanimicrobiaceae bacterium]